MGRLNTILLLLVALAAAQSVDSGTKDLMFLGRKVTVTEAEVKDGFFPTGPASVCLEPPPRRQCFTAPADFGRNATARIVPIGEGPPALLFKAESGGVSGWMVHFSLLRPGTGSGLDDLFASDPSISNQCQYEFWNEPALSSAPVFVTAEFIWGADEGHYGAHRYMISAYVYSGLQDTEAYRLDDRFMTARKYDLEQHADVLASEKQEILTRLRRVPR